MEVYQKSEIYADVKIRINPSQKFFIRELFLVTDFLLLQQQ